mmetsp:Transcript_40418/g.89787  ORF Transcript_40418/g.89787 Transcript_40418/m.89787 type:complete len:96 (+) Transcript_40418:1627-1914(+)
MTRQKPLRTPRRHTAVSRVCVGGGMCTGHMCVCVHMSAQVRLASKSSSLGPQSILGLSHLRAGRQAGGALGLNQPGPVTPVDSGRPAVNPRACTL